MGFNGDCVLQNIVIFWHFFPQFYQSFNIAFYRLFGHGNGFLDSLTKGNTSSQSRFRVFIEISYAVLHIQLLGSDLGMCSPMGIAKEGEDFCSEVRLFYLQIPRPALSICPQARQQLARGCPFVDRFLANERHLARREWV